MYIYIYIYIYIYTYFICMQTLSSTSIPVRLAKVLLSKEEEDPLERIITDTWNVERSETIQFSSVQLLIRIRLFVTPWIAALQASLSITNSHSLLKLMPIESVMPFSHLILCHPLLLLPPIFPLGSFPMSQLFAWGGQSIGVSASASVLPMNTQDWSP